jgi:hypothetical protein
VAGWRRRRRRATSVEPRARVEPDDGELAQERRSEQQDARHQQEQLQLVRVEYRDVRVQRRDEQRPEAVEPEDRIDCEGSAEDRAEVG